MNKIFFLLILISFLAAPMLAFGLVWVGYQGDNFQVDLSIGEDGKLGFYFGTGDNRAWVPQGQYVLYGDKLPMDFTASECLIKHDLSDYGPCAGWTIPGEPTSFTDCCLIDKILTIGDYIFILLLVVAVIVFLLAAWGFLTAQGEPEKVKNARNYVIYSIIGIAVAFLAKVLVRVVASIMT